MKNHQKTALIIGCGIAGPALALFLKCAGIQAEIYEAREMPEGYSLSLSCNGVAVLAELGLDATVFPQGSAVTKWLMWNGKGKSLGTGILASGDFKSAFIKRIPLAEILLDEAERQSIKIVRGKKLKYIEETDQGVIATFQDGTSASGDILIGSDGVHSLTRKLIDPSFPDASYTGLINSGGYTAGMNVASPPETLHFIFCKRAFFGYHVTSTGYIYWFTNWTQAEAPAKGAFNSLTDEMRRQQMMEIYHDDQPLIREIIQKAEATFPYFASYTLPKQPTSWHKGRVVLVGDAAHAISPSSGQGASMALEDAAILAKCLRDIPDVGQAFVTYEHLRRERTVKMYDVGERGDSGKYITQPMQQWFRDLMTPIFLKLFANPKASDWMYSYRVDWNKKIETLASTTSPDREMVKLTKETK